MARAVRYSATPIATGERLIASYGYAELIDMGVIDILQPDIAHVGGVTALWKVSAAAEASGIRMAPHACEGTDRRHCQSSRGRGGSELPGAGDLRLR